MKVILKLHANLMDRLPPGTKGHALELDLAADVCVSAVLDAYELPPAAARIVLVSIWRSGRRSPEARRMPASAAAPALVIEREVGATPGEFEHGLRAAFPDAVEGGPHRFSATYRGTSMDVELELRAARVIGNLSLPVLAVRLSFPANSTEEHTAMLARLDLATHRGGG
jgi:hypothetical protein